MQGINGQLKKRNGWSIWFPRSSVLILSTLLAGCWGGAGSTVKTSDSPLVSKTAMPPSVQHESVELSDIEVKVENSPVAKMSHVSAGVMYQLMIAEILAQRGVYAEAFSIVYQLAKQNQSDELAEWAFKLSMRTFNAANIAASTYLWRELAPDAVTPWRASYLISLRQGKVDQAMDEWRQFLALQKEPLESVIQAATRRVALSVPQESAIAFFQKIIASYPKQWAGYYGLAKLYEGYGQHKQGLAVALQASELRPNDAKTYQLLSNLYVQLDQVEEGLSVLGAYLKSSPEDWLVQERVARLEVQSGAFDAALERYLMILKSVPDAFTSRLSLALLYIERGLYDEAAEHLQEVKDEKGYVDVANYYLGLIAQENNRPEEALGYFEQVESENYMLDAKLHMAEIYFADKKSEQALELLNGIETDKDAEQIKIHRAKGVFYSLEDKNDLAQAEYQAALAIDGDNVEVLMAQALLFYQQENYADYLANLNNVLTLKPKEVDALNALGYYYVDKELNIEKAQHYLMQAYELAPDSYYVLDSVGWLYYHQQQYEKAERYLSKALAMQMDDEILVHLILTHWKLRQYAKAKQLWQENHQKFLKNKRLQGLIEELEKE